MMSLWVTTEAELCFCTSALSSPKKNKQGRTLRPLQRDHNISVNATYSLYFTASRTPCWLSACNQNCTVLPMATNHGRQTSVGGGCLVLQASLFGPGCCCSKALEPPHGTTVPKYAPGEAPLPRQPSRTCVCGVHPSDEYKVAGLRVASLLPFTASPSIHAQFGPDAPSAPVLAKQKFYASTCLSLCWAPPRQCFATVHTTSTTLYNCYGCVHLLWNVSLRAEKS